jgi:hypothetical protein
MYVSSSNSFPKKLDRVVDIDRQYSIPIDITVSIAVTSSH